MNHKEKIEHISEILNERVEYCISEYSLTLSDMIGVLEIIKISLYLEQENDL